MDTATVEETTTEATIGHPARETSWKDFQSDPFQVAMLRIMFDETGEGMDDTEWPYG